MMLMSVVWVDVALRSDELGKSVNIPKPKRAKRQQQRSGAMQMSFSDLCMRRQLAIGSDIASAPRMPRSVCDVCSQQTQTLGKRKCRGCPRSQRFKAVRGALAVTCALGTDGGGLQRSTRGVGAARFVRALSRVMVSIVLARPLRVSSFID